MYYLFDVKKGVW